MIKLNRIFLFLLLVVILILSFSPKVNASTPYDNLTFNAEYYLSIYPDLKAAFGNNYGAAYNHFMTCGIKEGRTASLIFDSKFYINSYTDLQKAFGGNTEAAYNHFMTFGIKEGRQSSPYFDVRYYLNKYPDLKKAFGNNYQAAYIHHINNGIKECRNPTKDIDIKCYLNSNPDLKKAFGNNYSLAFEHYYTFGYKENRPTNHNYSESTIPATCTTSGKIVYTCKCGDSYEKVIPATGKHTYTVNTQPATCVKAGKNVYICTMCGDNYEEVIPATGNHEYVEKTLKQATCDTKGLIEYTCKTCNDKYQKTIPEVGHKWEITAHKDAVHSNKTVSPEYTKKECTVCGKIDWQYGNIPEHNMSINIPEKTPTHFSKGSTAIKTCSICGYSEGGKELPILHESALMPSDAEKPTCTADGKPASVYCPVCHKRFYEDDVDGIYKATGHNYQPQTGKQPTCTEEGFTDYKKCVSCGDEIEKTVLEKTEHKYVTVPEEPSTCTEYGTSSYERCSDCGAEKGKRTLPKAEHNYTVEDSKETVHEQGKEFVQGYKKYKCQDCSYETTKYDVVSHNYITEGKLVPAEHSLGSDSFPYYNRTCTICGFKTKSYVRIAHRLISVGAADATCSSAAHGEGLRCIIEGCEYNQKGNGATAFDTEPATEKHDCTFRQLYKAEVGAYEGAIVAGRCNICRYTIYYTLDQLLEYLEKFLNDDNLKVIIVRDGLAVNQLTVPEGKTLIVYGNLDVTKGTIENKGNVFYENLKGDASNITNTDGGTNGLISENEEKITSILEDANDAKKEFNFLFDTIASSTP